jgi:5-hydroxyisourate hydrolase
VSSLSTHVLDTARGEPADGVVVRLELVAGTGDGGRNQTAEVGRAVTDADGRISDFGVASLPAGTYRLVFETGVYLSRRGAEGDGRRAENEGRGAENVARGADGDSPGAERPFFPEVIVTFQTDGQRPKYHIPLLLGVYSYTTYRGS